MTSARRATRSISAAQFAGPGKRMSAFLSAGDPYGKVDLVVRGGKALKTVSPFGVTASASGQGRARDATRLRAAGLRRASGRADTLRRAAETTGRTSRVCPASPLTRPARPKTWTSCTTGFTRTGTTRRSAAAGPWTDGGAWDKAQSAAPPPTLTGRDADPSDGTQDHPRRRVRLPTLAGAVHAARLRVPVRRGRRLENLSSGSGSRPGRFPSTRPNNRTTVDSFFSDRWVFPLSFPPVTTRRLRLLIHDATFGGGATKDVLARRAARPGRASRPCARSRSTGSSPGRAEVLVGP